MSSESQLTRTVLAVLTGTVNEQTLIDYGQKLRFWRKGSNCYIEIPTCPSGSLHVACSLMDELKGFRLELEFWHRVGAPRQRVRQREKFASGDALHSWMRKNVRLAGQIGRWELKVSLV